MSGRVVRPRARPLDIRLGVIAGLIAVAWAVLLLDPLGPAAIDPDASSSVLYFLRIVHGERLEAFVPTTPKPFLTLVYGLTWAIGHDWRWLAWETIAAFGLAVGATTALAARLAARVVPDGAQIPAAVASGAFATAALAGSSDLLLEVSRANSLVWALALWSLAGLAVTATPARPRMAGLLLLFAGLCRFETLALAAVAAGAAAVAWWRARRGGEPELPGGVAESAGPFAGRRASIGRVPLGRAPVVAAIRAAAFALAALPVALVHDWLLTGDPAYFLGVPERYTQIFNPGIVPTSPLTYAGTLAGRLAPEWPLLLLTALGSAVLARTRAWLVLAGLLAVGLGVVALLFALAARATYISNRYYEPIELVLIVTAAVGVGWLASRLPADRSATAPLAVAAAAIAGVAIMWPALPWDRRATTELGDVRRSSAHLATVRPELERTLVEGEPGDPQDAATELLVPSRDVSRLSVEIGQPLDRILNSYAVLLNQGVAGLEAGQVIFHDGAADRPVALYRALEIDDQGSVGGNILVRLDPRSPEIWLLSVR